MNLDFTRLKSISGDVAVNERSSLTFYPSIEREKEQMASELEEARKIQWRYAENTMKTNQLRVDINKSVNKGVSAYEILLKALECIALMTNDPAFYNYNKRKLESRNL